MRRILPACLLTLLAWPATAQDWSGIETGVQRGITIRLYPGAVVVVGRTDTILYAKGFGRYSWDARSMRPHPDSTLWDLASLTKVVATTSTALRLWERGTLDLDAPVSRYLPEYSGGGRELISVRMLLDHSSGLRAWAPLFRDHGTRDGMVHALLAEQPNHVPGTVTRYSDLNAMLLGLVLEAVSREPLDSVADLEVFQPLGLSQTRFGVAPADLWRTAPSRIEGGRASAGTVNDDNARRLRGVAGHAGVFSTGMDMARFAQAWLALARGRDLPWASATSARRFLDHAPRFRPLGWAVPDTALDRSSFGSLIHGAMVGHNGWTGTMLWLDPTHDLFVVFLTNRAISPRGNGSLDPIRLVRADVSDAAHRTVSALCPAAAGVAC